MGFLYFDTETTSFNPGQICELSVIVEDAGQVTLAKNYFFKVKSIDPGAQEVHGFSVEQLEELSNGKEFKDYLQELHNIFTTNVLIAHNLPCDEKFMSSEFWNCGISFKPIGRRVTMIYFKDILKIPSPPKARRYGPYKNPKLSEVIDGLNIDIDKVKKLCAKLFGGDESTQYHDSRLDTTAMYVMVNVQRERLNGGDAWAKAFCKNA